MTTDLETLRARYKRARGRLADAEREMEAANSAYERHVPRDPGLVSGVGGRSWGKRRDALSRRQGEAYRRWDAARKDARYAESAYRRAQHDAETAQGVDIDAIKPGDLVRIRGRGWHKVRRVNAKTITCEASPGFDAPRYEHDRIVEHKEATR